MKKVLRSGRPAVSDLYIGAVAKRPFIIVAVPVLRKGSLAYLLAMAVPPDLLARRLQLGLKSDEGWLATLIGTDGRVLARTRHQQDFLGKPLSADLVALLNTGSETGNLHSRTLDGGDVFLSYQKLQIGWVVIVMVPLTILNQPIIALWEIMILLLVLVAVASVVSVRTYGGRLGREVATLSANARAIGANTALVPLDHHILEVSDVQAAMIEASAKIKLLVAELDHRVKNTLAIVAAISNRTVENRHDRDGIVGRIGALSAAHEALSDSSWAGVDLCKLLSKLAENHGLSVRCEGPHTLLTPKAAVALAQTFRELLTNALQHGALSSHEGTVFAQWTPDSGNLTILWIESCADPSMTTYQPGFGMKIVELCICRQLGGRFRIDTAPGGWRISLSFPMDGDLGPMAHVGSSLDQQS